MDVWLLSHLETGQPPGAHGGDLWMQGKDLWMPFHKGNETFLSTGETDLRVLPQLKAKGEDMHRQVPSSTFDSGSPETAQLYLTSPLCCCILRSGIGARDKAADGSVDLSCHFSCRHKRVILLPSIFSGGIQSFHSYHSGYLLGKMRFPGAPDFC